MVNVDQQFEFLGKITYMSLIATGYYTKIYIVILRQPLVIFHPNTAIWAKTAVKIRGLTQILFTTYFIRLPVKI